MIVIVGVNGSGKTTSIAKLAQPACIQQGHKVLLGARADTFRAPAAVEQLTLWSERLGIEIIKQQTGADPAAVAFDAVSAAVARGVDYLILDTAGRLHTQKNLMEELRKIVRVVQASRSRTHRTRRCWSSTRPRDRTRSAKLRSSRQCSGGQRRDPRQDGRDGQGRRGAGHPPAPATARRSSSALVNGIDDLLPFSAEEFVDAILDRSNRPKNASDHRAEPVGPHPNAGRCQNAIRTGRAGLACWPCRSIRSGPTTRRRVAACC